MDIYLNNEKINIVESKKENILSSVKERIDGEIIDKIYLDEVEVSLDYFKDMNIKVNELEEIKFITKRTDVLIEETLLQAKDYLPKLKEALHQTADLYKANELNHAADKFNKCLNGLEWYTEVMNGIYNLIEQEQVSARGKELLEGFKRANNEALKALKSEDYIKLADVLQTEIIDYLDDLNNLNNKLIEAI